ncbi:hypothetical protein SEA_LOCHMONSTER_60 [Mycobacterium phage LochMonster]|uniref:Uncharacterized protein n=1 Tax=Mycobacterium phage Cintron TaxID=2686232 RepID=A0A6B9LG65_9CAUD|nr:hypothetical protein SEA_IRACEMA64_60 [Mycobacterium phage Iracema64]YP_010062698.1 hypothetical protein KIY71_gp58 [Mycobacterium phage Cintron]QBP29258.1 hypothetical protein SEA_PHIGHTER1804_59 [Mycobacterium phage Phighter1804]QBP29347.1 hypothetical protein SEA_DIRTYDUNNING_58 [Mycobacterium phage DirtyDunning]QXN74762.1 hypothetical protein SEA_ULYSSES_58 [Mycobacterium phage Ulysses]QXO13895.1 hypothetical protein SEA_LOCHMONSTER_60 [Mycobacterium phage LochMonster]WNM75679.1 hypoth
MMVALLVAVWGFGAWVYLCMEGLDDDDKA